MTTIALLGTACVIIALSGVVTLFRRVPIQSSAVLHLLGCAIGLGGAARALVMGSSRAVWVWHLPSGAIATVVDPLAAFFLFPVFVVSAAGALFGEGYWPEREHPTTARKLRCFYGFLTAALVVVVTAGDAWSFLAGWEIVGLAAFLLVTTEDNAEARRAGWIYLIATHAGTLALFAMFALLRDAAGTWRLERSAALSHSHLLAPALVVAIVAFGIKAGVMPVHVWLPEAHAAAPSHVSAMLSGVVLKMGIYGLVRVLYLLTAFPSWLGVTLLILGIVSGVLGVAFALAQHDLKRLLAYHSIENIGIILIGLGIGVLGAATGHPVIAALGFAGGLLHVWNHAVFKALLFYAAGAVVHTTGTRHIESLGGLLRPMRVTGMAFLVGAVAICGLPPLNGFVSEWLLYLAGFHALQARTAAVLGSIAVPALTLIGALALACFVKAFAVVFLGTPRTAIGNAHDATPAMRSAMIPLAIICIVIGVFPAVAGAVTARAVNTLTGGAQPAIASALRPLTTTGPFIVVAVIVAAMLAKRFVRKRRVTITWDCGYARPTERMQYTASSFAQQLVRLFKWALLPITHRPQLEGFFPAQSDFHTHVPDPILDRALLPGIEGSHRVMAVGRAIQVGHVQAYLLYIVVMLMILLAWSSM